MKEHVRVQIVHPESNQLQHISEQFQGTKSIWIPFLENKNISEFQTGISFIYVYNIDLQQDYLLGINHYDIPKLNFSEIIQNFNNVNKIILNKTYLNQFQQCKCIDARLISWYNTNSDFKFNENVDSSKLNLYYRTHKIKDINNYIPIMIFLDIARDYRNQILVELQKYKKDESFSMYNKLVLNELYRIEKSGIHVDKDIFFSKFAKVVKTDLVYTKFNPYTKTGRPSSHFNGVNYSAMNKSDGSRKCITSRFKENGILLELDYDSCHLRLVGRLLNYKLPKENIHHYFGQQYFNEFEITDEMYEESKGITFKELYGDTQKTDIPFFKMVKEYKNDLYSKYKKDSFIETPIFRRKIVKKFYKKMNPNKLFNYLIQSYETEYNVMIMKKINDYLEMNEKKTKLMLYTYDSFLFDFCRSDGKETMNDLIQITSFEIPVKTKVGKNYDLLKEVKFKI